MLIKVCGMRDADNIKAVAALDIDLMGFIFYPQSPRYVKMISSRAGIIPDYSEERLKAGGMPQTRPEGTPRGRKVGVFVDDMPQNIITRVYNYGLDYIQLHGDESPVMIDNLRRSLVPDIVSDIKIIKAISINSPDDLRKCHEYVGHADMLLFDTKCSTAGGSGCKFDWSFLCDYKEDIPFLLSGGIGPDDADNIMSIRHPMMAGIDLNSRFETSSAVKDVERLRIFITKIRNHEQDKRTV